MSDLKKLKNPIEKFKGVGISPDLPPKERDEIKRMLEAAKKAHVENETDSVENCRFLVVGRGPRRKVIKVKKNNPSTQTQNLTSDSL